MVRWMCGIKVRDRFPSKELRERSGIDDIAKQAAIEYEMEGPRPRRRPKRTWRELVEKDCQACKLDKEDAMDRSKMEEVDKGCQMIRMGAIKWANVSSCTGPPG